MKLVGGIGVATKVVRRRVHSGQGSSPAVHTVCWAIWERTQKGQTSRRTATPCDAELYRHVPAWLGFKLSHDVEL